DRVGLPQGLQHGGGTPQPQVSEVERVIVGEHVLATPGGILPRAVAFGDLHQFLASTLSAPTRDDHRTYRPGQPVRQPVTVLLGQEGPGHRGQWTRYMLIHVFTEEVTRYRHGHGPGTSNHADTDRRAGAHRA